MIIRFLDLFKFAFKSHRISLFLILSVLIIKGYYSEKILVNDGFGWDGALYGDYTKNIISYLKTHYIDVYHFQRIAIPLILHAIFNVFNIAFSDNNILLAFQFVNIICIIVSVIYFFLISNVLKLNRHVEIIGFASLFFCFPILKFSMYYPVLTDIPAFTMGIILVYCFLKKYRLMAFALIFFSSFIYPTFIVLGVLFFFKENKAVPLSNLPNANSNKWKAIFDNCINFLVVFFIPLFFCSIFLYLYESFENIYQAFINDLYGTLLIWLSFCMALIYIVYLNMHLKFTFPSLKSINFIYVFIALIIYCGVQFITNHFSSNAPPQLTLFGYFVSIIRQAVHNPMNFLVAHIFYFGTIPLLAFFIRNDIKKVILNYGFGMLCFFILFIFFSVGNESRQLINYYALVVFVTLIALNTYWNPSLLFSIIYCGVCLGLSHFWYNINTGLSTSTDFSNPKSFQEFPMQSYFMFQGPWVSDYMYVIHTFICLFLCICFWILFKKTNLIPKRIDLEESNL